ncbi:hypothetical protein ACPWT1_02835 [Ramlibacter sp. MMS24-I3-19]|uniref:hypothetical protein n=1 Tax=Ramlibacter sp. MMS24-I3-19 TaxID=3416606 RepID=UPI003D022B7F
MTGLPHAQHASRLGAAPATGGAAVVAKPGLPPRSVAKLSVIEESFERETANATETATATVRLEVEDDGEPAPKRLLAAGSIDSDALRFAFAAAARIGDEQARKIVVAARARLRAADDDRRARKDTAASGETLADYRKRCENLDAVVRASAKPQPDALRSALGQYAGARQSFQKMKSAARTLTLARIKLLLSQQDRLQRARGTLEESEWRPKWLAWVAMIDWGLSDLEVIDGLKRDECLKSEGLAPKPSRSKRKDVPRFDSNWRDRFLHTNERSATYRDAGVVLRFTGVRPAELERGVRLRRTEHGIRVRVAGAKVRETAGQPWRSFSLDVAELPRWFVELLPTNRSLVIKAQADSMRSHLYRQTRPVLNPTGRKSIAHINLSAYTFRHALVSDLRAAGWTAEDIAPVIGESSARTANLYGSAHTTGSVRPAIVAGSVRVPRAVKELDRSGLRHFAQSSTIAARDRKAKPKGR